MQEKTKRALQITGLSVAIAVMLLVWIVIGYLLYVVCSYNRLADNIVLSTSNPSSVTAVPVDDELTVMTFNIGFGAYGPEYSFFMDSGTTKDGVTHTGKYGKGMSKENVLYNTNGAIGIVKDANLDFAMIQEVDTDSDRSYHINQYEMLKTALPTYESNFAINYHSANLLYPFHDPHGKSNAGLATFSKYATTSSVRRSYPIASDVSKYLDLDRCFMVNHYTTANNKTLTVINHHMSAYDKGGKIRAKQLALIKSVLVEEYEKGNYVILGGDFNHALNNTVGTFESGYKVPEWVAVWQDDDTPDNFTVAADATKPTCRTADSPYVEGYSYVTTVDGFIVSDNIDVVSVVNNDTNFAYSDHESVVLTFSLKA